MTRNKKIIRSLLLLFLGLQLFILSDIQVSAAESKYKISINRERNCITIYELGEDKKTYIPFKAMVCSTPDNKSVLNLGEYTLGSKEEWKNLNDGTFAQFAFNIEGSISINAVPCLSCAKEQLITQEFNKLGGTTLKDCVSLMAKDAKWIYDNCEKGTKIEVYENASEDGPLGKPDTIKIKEEDKNSNWDPTDPDKNNPWCDISASVEGVKNIEISLGEELDVFKDVKAYDICGNDITKDILLLGSYDVQKPGKYTITYCIEDAVGSSDTDDAIITVKETCVDNGKETTREPVTLVSKEELDKKDKNQKIFSLITLGIVTLFGTIMISKYAKKD